MKKNLHIICSAANNAGQTLLARLFGDLLSFSGDESFLFDADFPDGALARWFPEKCEVINLIRMREQARLFDTVIEAPDRNYVVDLQPEHVERFFTMLHDICFDEGALVAGIGTGVFFLDSPSTESRKRAAWIRSKLRTASFTSVLNQARHEEKRTALCPERLEDTGSFRKVILPRLSPEAVSWSEKPAHRFDWFFSGGTVRPTAEVRLELSFFWETLLAWSRTAGWNHTLAL